ncbi:pseudouridine synthase [Chytriomyces sp. MP71]|nr:pseudouridine synthase [Chytriomyces sp. MP71]
MAANAPPELRGYDARYKREFRIQILYYNPRTFLIIDKPYDVRIDGPNDESPTIQDILNRSFPYHCEGTNKIRLVHQLDHVTSGVHVWGLDRIATRHACSLFEQRKVRKTYTALVGGWLQRDESVIEAPIAEMPNDDRKRMCVGTPDNPGRPAKTHLRVIRRGYMRFPGSGRVIRVTLCELKPESGRRHQLRVHMAGIGHAIVGDVLYEKPFSTDSPRTMLHANKLFMPLPVEGDINIVSVNRG